MPRQKKSETKEIRQRKELQRQILEDFKSEVEVAQVELCSNCKSKFTINEKGKCTLLPITTKGEKCPYYAN